MQDSDRSLLDWVVIFSRRLKADGQRAPWNYPANIAGAALPLSWAGILSRQLESNQQHAIIHKLRPIRTGAGKRATVELPGVLPLHHRGMLRGAELNRRCRVHENPQSTAR